MKLFAIGDLHLLGGDSNKSMDIFGKNWENHFDKICDDWLSRVKDSDLVLIPGDISWAMHLEDAVPDLEKIAQLPGEKVLIKGNHDYWWSSVSKIREKLPSNMHVIQNDSIVIGDFCICGSRGWLTSEGKFDYTSEDQKIYTRECQRLQLSLENAKQKAEGRTIIAMMHYPPITENGEATEFSKLLSRYNVKYSVYGHIHGTAVNKAFSGIVGDVEYSIVSADALNFKLKEIVI